MSAIATPTRTALLHRGVELASLTDPMVQALQASPVGTTMVRRVQWKSTHAWDLVAADLTVALQHVQTVLAAADLSPPAGNEVLDVFHPTTQARLATVARPLARVLGMEMHSAHLLLRRGEHVCLQRRSLSKPVDPGLWDTTVGGTRRAGQSIWDTLEREMQEEAGLALHQLMALTPVRPFVFRGEARYGDYPAYQHERVWLWIAELADPAWEPHCADGEVMAFDWVPWRDLLQAPFRWEPTHELQAIMADPQVQTVLSTQAKDGDRTGA